MSIYDTHAVNNRDTTEASNGELTECLLCGHLTEPNPHALHVRREGGASHGLIEAKAYICRDCLEDSDGWAYNQVQDRHDLDEFVGDDD